ncbi:ParB N-terminal domain-containing protein [Streptosporangium sp. NPDC020145]|uniref:ParB/RepB/Spo0J family partition protein n=1 Tax=Streptosporangium sp. NPDC020145 TaxID=3154694 RepID=UPI00343F1354
MTTSTQGWGERAAGRDLAGAAVLGEDYRSRLSEVGVVSVTLLLPSDSPRILGEDPQHVRLLAELDTVPPPLVAHRWSMRVVDGMHRLRAATLRGEGTVQVRFFDGDDHEAFVIAVRENTTHGLPLSADDRARAAGRIVRSYPHWSDRAISRIVGLSARVVRDIRRAASPEGAQPAVRLGQDGRVRPLDSSAGRTRAAELIMKEPSASLRRIAQQAGISPGTVQDVRDRLRRGEGPLPSSARPMKTRPEPEPQSQRKPESPPLRSVPSKPGYGWRRASPLGALINDPSFRSVERGRILLRLLSAGTLLAASGEDLLDAVPEHCVGLVSQAAKANAAAWMAFATDLERRTTRSKARAKG